MLLQFSVQQCDTLLIKIQATSTHIYGYTDAPSLLVLFSTAVYTFETLVPHFATDHLIVALLCGVVIHLVVVVVLLLVCHCLIF